MSVAPSYFHLIIPKSHLCSMMICQLPFFREDVFELLRDTKTTTELANDSPSSSLLRYDTLALTDAHTLLAVIEADI